MGIRLGLAAKTALLVPRACVGEAIVRHATSAACKGQGGHARPAMSFESPHPPVSVTRDGGHGACEMTEKRYIHV